MAAGGGIDHQVEFAGLNPIHRVGPTFIHFEYGFANEARLFERGRGTTSSKQLETEFAEFRRDGNGCRFIAIVDADEESASIGNRRACSKLRFSKRFAEAC